MKKNTSKYITLFNHVSFITIHILAFIPIVALSSNITLEQAMTLAEKKSYSARISLASQKEAEAKASQSLGALFPKLEFDAKRIWLNDSVNKGVGVLPQAPERLTTASLSVSQPIIGLAPLYLLKKVNENLAENSKEDARIAGYEARFMGAEAFVRAVRLEEGVKIASISLESVTKQYQDAKALFNAGRISQADLLRFELAFSDAKLQKTQAETGFQFAKVVLGETIGIPATELKFSNNLSSLWEQNKYKIPDADDALQQATKNRPDLKNAENKVEAAKYYTLASRLDYLPSLNAFASYERDFEAKDVDLIPRYLKNEALQTGVSRNQLKSEDIRDKFSYGLQLKWTIWDWNTRLNKSQEIAALEEKARIAQEASLSSLKIDVSKGVQELQTASAALESAQTSVKLAQEVYRLTQLRFNNSQASSSDLISSERDASRARANLLNARADADLTLLRFQRVIGKQPTTQL
jgi:outer membrane protein